MADVGAESMIGGTTFHREMIQREISRALVLNLSGKASGATALPRIFLSLTAPSLLSRTARSWCRLRLWPRQKERRNDSTRWTEGQRKHCNDAGGSSKRSSHWHERSRGRTRAGAGTRDKNKAA